MRCTFLQQLMAPLGSSTLTDQTYKQPGMHWGEITGYNSQGTRSRASPAFLAGRSRVRAHSCCPSAWLQAWCPRSHPGVWGMLEVSPALVSSPGFAQANPDGC